MKRPGKASIKPSRTLRKGQTMTEYALALGAVTLVAFGAYQQMGKDTRSLVHQLDRDLVPHHHHR